MTEEVKVLSNVDFALKYIDMVDILDQPFSAYANRLEDRELLLLKMSAFGYSDEEIAELFEIKPDSVRMARSRALRKIDLEGGRLTKYVFERLAIVVSDPG